MTESGGIPILPPPAANHSATTDDFLQRPIIPQVSLIGSVGNKFVLAEQQAIIVVRLRSP